MVAPTGRPMQGHLVYGTNNAKWYLFYLTGTQTLSLAYSSDFVTWTTSGTTLTLAAAHASEGRNYGFKYLNLAATDIVYFETGTASGNNRIDGRGRLTLGATAWTVTNAETTGSRTGASVGIACPVPVVDSTNTAWFVSQFAGLATSAGYRKATNADTGTAWTAGVSTPTNILSETNAPTALGTVPLASGVILFLADNTLSAAGSFTNVRYVPGAGNAEASVLASNLGTAQDTNDWCVVKISNTDVHFVCRTGANTYTHARYNGTDWTSVAGASIPTQASVAGAGLFLAPIGSDVYLFVIDASNNIKVSKWTATGNAWGATWATADAGGAAARTYLTGYQQAVSGSIGLTWTQANGSNFDITGALYTPTTPYPAALLAVA